MIVRTSARGKRAVCDHHLCQRCTLSPSKMEIDHCHWIISAIVPSSAHICTLKSDSPCVWSTPSTVHLSHVQHRTKEAQVVLQK